MSLGINLAERGAIPDSIVRFGIRRLCRQRAAMCTTELTDTFHEKLANSPVAIKQEKANDQHYMVMPHFFEQVLGRHLKYSSAWWDEGTTDLSDAEEAMLDLYVERAGIEDGQDILDVGCGWGSLSCYLGKRFPNATITSLSNSSRQRLWIEARCRNEGIKNVSVITHDLADFHTDQKFDRLVSVECLEHMRNYGILFERFASWLRDDGQAFIHVFVHKEHCYPFEEDGDDNWMGRHFFSGGIMPSHQTFEYFNKHLSVVDKWVVNGTHYGKTARAWLENLDRNRAAVESGFRSHYDATTTNRIINRWRIFFMACEELWNYDNGEPWHVGHYLLRKS